MEKDLIKFYDNIEIINKDLSKYEDNKGNMFILNTINLLTRIDYLEVGTDKSTKLKVSEYDKMLFEKKIEDLDYKKITKKSIRIKSEITGKKEDSTTLIEEEVPAVAIWNVSNPYGVFKSYTDKDEAVKYAKEVNEKILKYYK